MGNLCRWLLKLPLSSFARHSVMADAHERPSAPLTAVNSAHHGERGCSQGRARPVPSLRASRKVGPLAEGLRPRRLLRTSRPGPAGVNTGNWAIGAPNHTQDTCSTRNEVLAGEVRQRPNRTHC